MGGGLNFQTVALEEITSLRKFKYYIIKLVGLEYLWKVGK
jgi:hypothetical protein